MSSQLSMFERKPELPGGFRYHPDFLGDEEERTLVAEIERLLPFREFEFHGFSGRRRVVSFGWQYDFNQAKLRKTEPIPGFLLSVLEKVARFANLDEHTLKHLLVTEYEPGAPIGWHKDRAIFRRRDRYLSPFTVYISFPQKGWRRLGARIAPHRTALRLSSTRPCAHRLGAQHSRRGAAPLYLSTDSVSFLITRA